MSFVNYDTHLFVSIDGTVTESSLTIRAVPEPASWALMLGGFGAIGGAMRSRKRTAVSLG